MSMFLIQFIYSLRKRSTFQMENYNDFLNRINSFENPTTHFGYNYFTPNPSLAAKVDSENRFRPFYGDTVVFNLDADTKNAVAEYANLLHSAAPECFCENLIPDTFHMTLHDLSNAPCLHDVASSVFENQLNAVHVFREIQPCTIKMQSKYVFNMVSTSLVLGLYPENEAEYDKLMKLYYAFDRIRPLPYPLTPHITLAYYNSHGFDTQSARRLEEAIEKVNNSKITPELDTKNLYYQIFTGMNNYVNILSSNTNKF